MQKHSISVRKTARVFTSGNVTTAKEVWIVLHGYAQLADEFGAVFSDIANEGRAIVAPEGLHRFYRKGFYGDVVSSWMTKEDRLDDIKDYISYLDQVVAAFAKPDQKITVFGFSQGVATACRWVASGDIKPEKLILWAGSFPDDVHLKNTSSKLQGVKCYLAYDENDVFRNKESDQKQRVFIESLGVHPEIYTFDGGHAVSKTELNNFMIKMLW